MTKARRMPRFDSNAVARAVFVLFAACALVLGAVRTSPGMQLTAALSRGAADPAHDSRSWQSSASGQGEHLAEAAGSAGEARIVAAGSTKRGPGADRSRRSDATSYAPVTSDGPIAMGESPSGVSARAPGYVAWSPPGRARASLMVFLN